MGKNLVREEFLSDTTWTCPAGVTQVSVQVVNFVYRQINVGNTPNFAIDYKSNGYAWGSNAKGELGVGDTTPRSSPIIIQGGLIWRQISCKTSNTVAGINSTRDAYAWGNNANGQLGLGDVVARSSPVIVLGSFKWRQVAAGASSIIGIIAAGDAYAWGNNANGQLGLGNTTAQSSPIIVLGSHKWRQLACGNGCSYGIDSNGDLYAWGVNANGELGLGDVVPRSSPVIVLGGLKWRSMRTGASSTNNSIVGIDQYGNAYAWGNNANGQLGLGDVVARSSPVAVLGGLKFRETAIDNGSTIGLDSNGVAYTWGLNTSGQLGLGDVLPRSSPVAVLGGLKWIAVDISLNAMGLTSTADAYSWGGNLNGQLGLGDVTPRSSPIIVLGGFKYQTSNNIMSNKVFVDVIPGTAYAVTIYGLIAMFDYLTVYQDPYNSGGIPTKIYLEYEA